MEGIPALSFWDEVIELFCPEASRCSVVQEAVPDYSTVLGVLSSVDWVPPSLPPVKGYGKLEILEDNDAVIKSTINGRSPKLRHVPRVQNVDLDWLWERIRVDPGISIKHVITKLQIADMLTKANFSGEQ